MRAPYLFGHAVVDYGCGLARRGSLCLADPAGHSYSREERYAGCLFGDTVPLLRRGYERNRALSIASWNCASLSTELSAREIQKVSDFVNFSIDMLEH